ncbi:MULTISPECIES: type IX secretion system membrane protein PorP/SprF [Flavobacteriaceae]|uniref:PorP/SprF family type IX secretion system membrane protein n=1 Tax=Flavobacteriaceae TaxID=49546 RepID=UPI0010AE0A6B|nr:MULTISPECIES: type IX secretion system membrane protein PorP/SprF [Flavobacteriaceae]NJB38086.1 type IX secretion system membrane protein PorP/SprF [Croceivirga sp. JEA036]TKD55701.1 type IX secretion system membrane protein PorP/SprF [Flavobacterium sp. ASW18X]
MFKYIFKHKKTTLAFVALVMTLGTINAQQDAQYTQYMYNTMSVNPAYAGSRGHLSLAALYRNQWIGLDGAPETQTLNVHSPIGYRGVGLGVSIVNDKIGPTSETYFDADFSYTIYTSAEGRLSFGLKASAHLLNVDFDQLNQDDVQGSDATLQANIDNRFSPNIGAGVYYHTEKFYAGLSVPRFLETEHFAESSQSVAKERMNFYLITGYVWDLNDNLKFKPAVLGKMVNGAPLQVDLSANFMFNEKFIGGVAYRWDAAFSGMFGFNISEQMFLGLAYDREITELGSTSFNDGSFEVIFRFEFLRSEGNLKSPRFF